MQKKNDRPLDNGATSGDLVSVVVPCYNEQATIRLLLEAIIKQSYPQEQLEVIIADGLSTDRTREEIAKFQRNHPSLRIQVVDNPARNIPSGLNRALEVARGEYIVRLDAHSMPYPDYIQRCIIALQAGKGENVGGVWEIRPREPHWIPRGIAAAAAHPLGVGDARYRFSRRSLAVDTVPFGAFHRSLIDRIGPFDETLLTNEDYEFNVRVREAGGQVWLDPAIRSVYFARASLGALARQYWRYGYWKARMLFRYPHTLRWRQLAPLLVLSLIVFSTLSIWFPLARWLLLFELSVYGLALMVAGIQTGITNRTLSSLISVPLAIATMHFSWGTGFLWSLITIMLS
jgi:glycosyltransferase involved in cell wall biosynthesis